MGEMIDKTPTWESLLPYLLTLLQDTEADERRTFARKELERMAKAADVRGAAKAAPPERAADARGAAEAAPPETAAGEGRFEIVPLWQVERDVIERAIAACGGSIPQAAVKLGISASTIYRKKESWPVQ